MKQFITLSLLLLASTFVFSQRVDMDKWKELKDFHEVMAATYHPSEKGDLKPIRTQAADLAAKADALQRSKYPAEYDNAQMRIKVKHLYAAVTEVKSQVDKKGSDENISKSLSEAHALFHDLIGEKEKDSKEDKVEHHDAH